MRGIDKYLAGWLSEDTLIDNLAKEWASLPTTSGKGYYGGQHAAVPTLKVRSVSAEVKRRHAEVNQKRRWRSRNRSFLRRLRGRSAVKRTE